MASFMKMKLKFVLQNPRRPDELDSLSWFHLSLPTVIARNLPVNLAAIADPHDKDFQNLVLNARNNAVIPYAVFPKLTPAATPE